jgi:hypothetical protein
MTQVRITPEAVEFALETFGEIVRRGLASDTKTRPEANLDEGR